MKRIGIACLAVLALGCGADGVRAQGTLAPPQPIRENFAPYRVSARVGVARTQGDVEKFMDGGSCFGFDLDLPLGHQFELDVPITLVRRKTMKFPMAFPYTDDQSFLPGMATTRGYCNSAGLGIRWEPRLDLEVVTRSPYLRLEPSVRVGLAHTWVGWEPRPDAGGGASDDYRDHTRYAAQGGWGPFAGAGIAVVRYSDGDIPSMGIGLDYLQVRTSAGGDALEPVGTSASGGVGALTIRLFAGTR